MSFEVELVTSPSGRLRHGPIPWDTEAFGFPATRLVLDGDPEGVDAELEDLLDAQRGHGPALVVCRVPAERVDWVEVLSRAGFYAVEASIEPHHELKRYAPGRRLAGLRLRPLADGELPRVVEIASAAFSRGRYHLDPNLPRAGADARYARWIENAVRAGEPVFVYEDVAKGALLGFYHVRDLGGGTADLSLAALDVAAQGAGLGLLMYDECLEVCKARGFARVRTSISLANTAVLNVYAELGFRFRDPELVLHWCAHASGSMLARDEEE